MSSVNRFIQFNNETIDARQLMHYETIARAMTKDLGITINERKLIEFQPEEQTISISVFWRHRSEEVMHKGRLSDIYLLTEGFWKYFSIGAWLDYLKDRDNNLSKLMDQLVFCLEEFRLMEYIQKRRIGTRKIFIARVETYLAFHKQQLNVNLQKGFLADAYISYLYISLYEGTINAKGPEAFIQTNSMIQRVYDHISTNDSIDLAYQLVNFLTEYISTDSILQFYAILSPNTLMSKDFHYHQGMKDSLKGEDERKDTIEEVFRSWHRENEQERGVHLQYELEHGTDGKAEQNVNAEEGREGHDITETGRGQSAGNTKENLSSDQVEDKMGSTKKAGKSFGYEHLNVIYEEKRIESMLHPHTKSELQTIRQEQAPFVRAFVHEMKKRMEQKKVDKRTNLSKGRLSTRMTSIWTEERPKPFYKKDAPSTRLNAVFGLLVDGSASMQDKMPETQKAVLLFHDVLRELNIAHEIVLHYEDAYEATETSQPNTFEWIHRLEDGQKDSGQNILAMEAHEDNRDGFAIRWIGKRLETRPETHKFLLVFSDGEPSAFGYAQNGIMDTAEAVLEVERKQISILHLFLNEEEPTDEQINLFQLIFGKKTATASSMERFSDETLRLLRKMLQHVVKS
ncbi:VWA domain-containing protein [Psychrobacillus sp. BL-248-WT-3]|uniref:vWA domain-containing protein n=1 Tax=Psychrobacillus sp. BL-248-WT-3 TaxID=2725306 RepID=UPI00146AF6E1|nr:VWA domain-containing protein [Psychrobacillus sp. BL-248-WT-3]NME06381.1 VWA domain-containing protein [Psychrobacillus sp. BL-248-WT-3]